MIAVFDFIILFSLWVFRGLYLWVLIPAAFLAWISIHAWRQKSSFGECLGWYDWNIFVFLATGLVGVRAGKYIPNVRYAGLADMSNISHRVGRMRRTLQNLDTDAPQSGI